MAYPESRSYSFDENLKISPLFDIEQISESKTVMWSIAALVWFLVACPETNGFVSGCASPGPLIKGSTLKFGSKFSAAKSPRKSLICQSSSEDTNSDGAWKALKSFGQNYVAGAKDTHDRFVSLYFQTALLAPALISLPMLSIWAGDKWGAPPVSQTVNSILWVGGAMEVLTRWIMEAPVGMVRSSLSFLFVEGPSHVLTSCVPNSSVRSACLNTISVLRRRLPWLQPFTFDLSAVPSSKTTISEFLGDKNLFQGGVVFLLKAPIIEEVIFRQVLSLFRSVDDRDGKVKGRRAKSRFSGIVRGRGSLVYSLH